MEKFIDIATRAQRLANERGGDYSSLTFDELCTFMVEYDRALDDAQTSPQDKTD